MSEASVAKYLRSGRDQRRALHAAPRRTALSRRDRSGPSQMLWPRQKRATAFPSNGADHKSDHLARDGQSLSPISRPLPPLWSQDANRPALTISFVTTTDFISSLSGGGRADRFPRMNLAPLLQALQDHVAPRRGELNSEDLKSLVGSFMVYRQAWTSPRPDDFMISVMTFEGSVTASISTRLQQDYH